MEVKGFSNIRLGFDGRKEGGTGVVLIASGFRVSGSFTHSSCVPEW